MGENANLKIDCPSVILNERLNNPGTDELMVKALKRGCTVVGAAPYTDSNSAWAD